LDAHPAIRDGKSWGRWWCGAESQGVRTSSADAVPSTIEFRRPELRRKSYIDASNVRPTEDELLIIVPSICTLDCWRRLARAPQVRCSFKHSMRKSCNESSRYSSACYIHFRNRTADGYSTLNYQGFTGIGLIHEHIPPHPQSPLQVQGGSRRQSQ